MREHQVRVRHAALAETDDAVRADQIDGASYDQPVGFIKRAGFLALVDKEWKRQTALGDEFRVALGVLWVYAEHQRILLLRTGPAVAEFAQLPATAGGVIAGIKHQHHVV